MAPTPVRVRRVVRETPDVVTLHLDPPGGIDFAPGQFNMLYLFGVGEVAISISGDPAQPGDLAHTIRAVGTVTHPLTRVRRGSMVGVRGPYGHGWPIEEAAGRDLVLIAGGIGLAPLRPAILQILQHRGEFGRVAVLYGSRRPREILYREDLRAWSARDDLDLQTTVDYADEAWSGAVGVVTGLLDGAVFDPGHCVAMLCGPEVMMRFAVRALRERGVGTDSIHLSLERNMKCALGHCGRCQLGPTFACKDGPVLRFDRIERFFGRRGM